VADDGTEIQKANKAGPNLYGVIGRQAGTADFKYGASLVAAGEKGLVWTEELIVDYLKDPQKFLRAYLDDNKAKSNMSFKLAKGGEDVAAYLASVAPASTN
jgi:cytochrome c